MTSSIKSTAGRVLASSDDPEAKSLAAYVLQDDPPVQTTRNKNELQGLLRKIEGMEGQSDRYRDVQRQLEAMG